MQWLWRWIQMDEFSSLDTYNKFLFSLVLSVTGETFSFVMVYICLA